MSMKWFQSEDVDAFADSIVAEVVRRIPLSGPDLRNRKAGQKLQRSERAIFSRIEAFARATELNVYRKARLGNKVKWSLSEAGYPKPFVDAFTHEVVALLAVARPLGREGRQK